jgi:Tol biopolymer transport system component
MGLHRYDTVSAGHARVACTLLQGTLPLFLAASTLLIGAPELDAQTRGRPPAETRARLQYVTSVRQLGPVAYRDPLGALSPDGVWLAFTSGRRLAVQRVAGGPLIELGRTDGRFTRLTWHPNSRHVVVREQSFDRRTSRWFSYDRATLEREPLFPDGFEIKTPRASTVVSGPTGQQQIAVIERRYEVRADELDELAWSPSGRRIAGIKPEGKRSEVWLFEADGSGAQAREIDRITTNPAWHADEADVACLTISGRDIHPQMEYSCGGSVTGGFSPVAYGRFAFSPDGRLLYYAAPNELGTLDLWMRGVPGTGANPRQDQLTRFARDTYAPSVSRDGKILFKTQDYRAHIAYVPAEGGPSRQVTTFQSEIPSWSWSGERIAFTFGSWRQATDDLRYPEIEQHLGYVTLDGTLPESRPGRTVRSSEASDQGMHWSPDGRWIAFYSHADESDDIWLMEADGSGEARRISEDGFETGWPRWSPDGRWIVYPGFEEHDGARRGGLYLIGIDQETGEVTAPSREIPLTGPVGEVSVAEWSPDSQQIVFESDDGSGTKTIYAVAREGGAPRVVHAYESEQRLSGIGVSPDFAWVAYIAPDREGRFQLWRVPLAGGDPEPLTFDPTDKAHPSYSPQGDRIAFTVYNYEAIFWLLEP